MKTIAITPSPEPCAEAGWHAVQFHLDQPVDRTLIMGLRHLGSLLVLEHVRQPFFKIESHYYMIKGLLGDMSIRVAAHHEHEEETHQIILDTLLHLDNHETTSDIICITDERHPQGR